MIEASNTNENASDTKTMRQKISSTSCNFFICSTSSTVSQTLSVSHLTSLYSNMFWQITKHLDQCITILEENLVISFQNHLLSFQRTCSCFESLLYTLHNVPMSDTIFHHSLIDMISHTTQYWLLQ